MTLNQQKPGRASIIATFLRRHRKTALLIIVVAAATLAVSAFISIILDDGRIMSLPSVGYIHTLGVKAYWDPGLQNLTTKIDWGILYPDSSNSFTLYLQSISNVATRLSLATANWTYINRDNVVVLGPTESTPYMSLTWDYQGQVLNPNQTLQATLTLTVENSPGLNVLLTDSNVTQFTVDISIQATEK
jgi:hypothetical protein